MMTTGRIAVVVLAALVFTGCATGKDIERIEGKLDTQTGEIRGMRQELDEVRYSLKDQKKMISKVDDISAGIDSIKEELEVVKRNQASLGNKVFSMSGGEAMEAAGRLDEIDHEIQDTKLKLDAFKAALLQKLSDMEYALSSGSQGQGQAQETAPDTAGEETTGAPEPSQPTGGMEPTGEEPSAQDEDLLFTDDETPSANTPPPVDDPLILYNAAYMDYTKGNYELALMGFKDYLEIFPDGELAGNSQYWVGESLYSLGHYTQALIEFEKVVTNYPKSPKAAAAILKKGYCFEKLGRSEDAAASFREVVKKYPGTEPAGIADQKLNPPMRGVVEGR